MHSDFGHDPASVIIPHPFCTCILSPAAVRSFYTTRNVNGVRRPAMQVTPVSVQLRPLVHQHNVAFVYLARAGSARSRQVEPEQQTADRVTCFNYKQRTGHALFSMHIVCDAMLLAPQWMGAALRLLLMRIVAAALTRARPRRMSFV